MPIGLIYPPFHHSKDPAAMPRFFLAHPLAIGDTVTLPDNVSHHIQVLRLAQGSNITIFNGDGGEYVATLTSIAKREVIADIKTFTPREAELAHALTLAQALPEASKMDWIIEKAVELGATSMQPLAAQRCVVKLAGERAAKKAQHWQGIAIAAAEQSGRNRLLQIAELAGYPQWITQQDLHRRILLTPRAEQSLSGWARHHPPQAVTLIVGPEGGFTEQEEDMAIKHGALALSMGPRILRTETAGLAALAAINAIWAQM